jgi:hypothetical protein
LQKINGDENNMNKELGPAEVRFACLSS